MSNKVFVISDTHFGHTNMALKRGFASVEEHDETIIRNWNEVVSKKDTVWLLGDVTMEKTDSYPLLDRLNGIKKVVLGNHDRPQHVTELLKYVNSVCGMIRYKGFVLTHCPIHESELKRFKGNIHGHIHDSVIDDSRYINVSAEVINFTPILFSDIKI